MRPVEDALCCVNGSMVAGFACTRAVVSIAIPLASLECVPAWVKSHQPWYLQTMTRYKLDWVVSFHVESGVRRGQLAPGAPWVPINSSRRASRVMIKRSMQSQ